MHIFPSKIRQDKFLNGIKVLYYHRSLKEITERQDNKYKEGY